MKKNNKIKMHPVSFIILLSIFVVVVSGVLSLLKVNVRYDSLTGTAGEIEVLQATITSLFNFNGLIYIISRAVENFTIFMPIGVLIIGSLSFGVAYKSGFLNILFKKTIKKFPKPLLVFIFSFICIIAGFSIDLGYIILLPMSAVLFMSLNRNPLVGISLAFASIAAGHGAGVFITELDYHLATYTQASAKLIDLDYVVSPLSNIFFMIVISVFLALICTYVTEFIMKKKLSKNLVQQEELISTDKQENKGLLIAGVLSFIFLVILIMGLIPGNHVFGFLLDNTQEEYAKMLFGAESYFSQGVVYIFSILLLLQGIGFGIASGSIKKIKDIVNLSSEYMKTIAPMFVLLFFASQFIAICYETNIGYYITASLANLIKVMNFSFIPLILVIILFAMISNLFFPSTIQKWAIFSPSIMPLVMKANINPEFAQLVFRAGDSLTNSITPLFPYFILYIGFLEIYTKNKQEYNIRECYKFIFPYFLFIMLIWLFIIVSWYIIGIPIGPNMFPGV